MRESDIMYEYGTYWVGRERGCYTVYKPSPSGTHSVADSSYTLSEDGLSLAKSRCKYIGKRAEVNRLGRVIGSR